MLTYYLKINEIIEFGQCTQVSFDKGLSTCRKGNTFNNLRPLDPQSLEFF